MICSARRSPALLTKFLLSVLFFEEKKNKNQKSNPPPQSEPEAEGEVA